MPLIVFMNSTYERTYTVGNVRIGFCHRQLLYCLRRMVFLILLFILAGCETLSFYGQLASGQLDILRKREPVERLLKDSSIDRGLRQQLAKIKDIQAFASLELGLNPEGSFTTYVDLNRDYALWNVYAAEAYAVHPVNRCYPLAGCVPYRGYFSKELALDYARRMSKERGLETYVGGVSAYSTLGWFKDPILSTFIYWEDQELASLIIHELLHQRIWLKGDAQFNEGLASFVGNTAAIIWSQKHGRGQENQRFLESQKHWRLFRQFVVMAREYLQIQFLASEDSSELSVIKSKAMRNIRDCYLELNTKVFDGRYEKFVLGDQFNNAFIASIGVYESDYLAYKRLFDSSGHEWPVFFEKIEELMRLSREARHAELKSLSNDEITGQADDDDAQQVHCKTF